MKKLIFTLGLLLTVIGLAKAETASITFSDMFSTNSTELTDISLNDVVSVSFDKAGGNTSPQYYPSGTAIRFYGGNTMTVNATENIVKIEITFGSGDGSNAISADTGTFASPTWTGSATSVTFTVGGTSGNRRIAGLTVIYGEDGGDTPGGGETPNPPVSGESTTVTYDSSTKGYANAQVISTVEEGDVTIEFNKGSASTAPTYYNTGTAVRVYGGSYFTVSVPENCSITKIELIYGSGDGTNAITADVGNFVSPVWTGDASSVKFTIGGTSGHRRIKAIDVTYVTNGVLTVAAPKISCSDNLVTITCSTEDADIYYTVDGTTPSQSSSKYSTPFEITENTTVKAIAYKDGEESAVTTYDALYIGSYPGFEALANQGANAEGIVEGPITVVYQNGQYLYVVDNLDYPMLVFGNVNTTLTNGQTLSSLTGKYSPYNGLPEITSPVLGTVGTGNAVAPQNITGAVTESLINRYVKFENVTIDGTNMTYGSNTTILYNRFSGVEIPNDTKNYNVTGFVSIYSGTLQVYPISFEEVLDVNQVEAPVFNPNGGAVEVDTQVAITTATEGASIYYTTDGTEPSEESTLYQNPITITEAVTIKAIAIKDGMTDSYVTTAEFTVIDPNATEVTYDFTKPSTLDPSYSDEGESGNEVDVNGLTFTNGVISLTSNAAEGASNKPRLYYGSGSAAGWSFRFYNDNTITIAAQEGYMITSIEFPSASNLGNSTISWSEGTYSNSEWTAPTEAGIQSLVISKTASGNNPIIYTMIVHYIKDTQTGVETVEIADDSEAVYYNLQGVRVNNPERGIFIKVQNGKAVKVIK